MALRMAACGAVVHGLLLLVVWPRGGGGEPQLQDLALNTRGAGLRTDGEGPPEGGVQATARKPTVETYTRCVARNVGVDEDLVVAVMMQESDPIDPHRAGADGSLGPLQIKPIALVQVGLSAHERSIPVLIYGGVLYLKEMLERFRTLPAALAAYNMGPGRLVERDYRPFETTRRYVSQILARARRLRAGATPSLPVLRHPVSVPEAPRSEEPVADLASCLRVVAPA